MCGIAGICHFTGEPAGGQLLQRMTDAIGHRGPGGQGHYLDGPVGLGHRRLAILDLSSAGHQPMATEDGAFVLTYNGEVYNFAELRTELESLGWPFHSRTDTEVVLKAYAQWGPQCVTRLNGMFAFAIWDRRKRELCLVRDRYGIKPLYYWHGGGTFLFASEVKSLLEHPAFTRRMNLPGLLEYMTFQNFFTDQTLLEGVRLLPPGSYMHVRLEEGRLPPPTVYWDFAFAEPPRRQDKQVYIEELDHLFTQAVNRQLVSDVEIGAYLSGGMDSGSVTAIAAGRLPSMKSFTLGFELHSAGDLEAEIEGDERPAAELMSYLFKTEHYEMVLKAGDMERCLPRLARHLDEPRVGQSYPNYYAARLASKFVKVVLSGTGGDELFGGYPWRYYRGGVNDSFEHYVDKSYAFWQRLIPQESTRAVFAPVWPAVRDVSTRDILRRVFPSYARELTAPEDYIHHSLYFEAKTFLHGLLVVEDKLSMAHSLETRVPFLDNDLVDFAMRVPADLKVGSTVDGKLLLRQMMGRYLPAAITTAGKRGFSAPDAAWFKGESIDFVRRTLYQGRPRIYEFFDRRAVLSLVDDHLQGRENRRLLIWSLLNLEHWCEAFL